MISTSKGFTVFVYVFLIFLILCCVIPFWLLIASSLTSETTLLQNGYSLVPREFSLSAYKYLWTAKESIGRAYLMSVLISAVGVSANVLMCILFAYPLSRQDLPGRRRGHTQGTPAPESDIERHTRVSALQLREFGTPNDGLLTH